MAPLRERSSIIVLVLAAVSFAYFVGAPAWNQNSRFALTRALVESGTTAIDPHHHTTGDKSFRDGHFYSDKAPGVSFFAVVPYAAYDLVRRGFGADAPGTKVQSLDPRVRELGAVLEPEDRKPGDKIAYSPAYRFALYVCTFFVVVLPTAILGGGGVLLLGRRLWGERGRSIALCFCLATPVWVYATSLYGHALCGALLIAALAVLELADDDAPVTAPLAAGLLLGAAVITEYPSAVVALMLVGYAVLRRGRTAAAWVIVGGIPWALLLAGYHAVAFGSPLRTGYDFVYREEFAEGMAVRYGLGAPDPHAALALLFGSFRGLFYLSPLLLLATWGLVVGLRDPKTRPLHGLCLLVSAYFWLLNAGYYMWDGGASAGPRHMVPALGFVALGLGPAFARVPRATIALATWSVLQAMLLAAASPEVAQSGDPLWEFAFGHLLEARPSATTRHTNLGLLLGLPGPLSIAPLLAGIVWGALQLRRSASTQDAADRPAATPPPSSAADV
ncbi:MAG: hypothetical protein AAGA54_17065 [Myxococcota bacterium]